LIQLQEEQIKDGAAFIESLSLHILSRIKIIFALFNSEGRLERAFVPQLPLPLQG
jgi:hypothetical protein